VSYVLFSFTIQRSNQQRELTLNKYIIINESSDDCVNTNTLNTFLKQTDKYLRRAEYKLQASSFSCYTWISYFDSKPVQIC